MFVDIFIIYFLISTSLTKYTWFYTLSPLASLSYRARIYLKWPIFATKGKLSPFGFTSALPINYWLFIDYLYFKDTVVGFSRCPLKVMQKLTTSPFKTQASVQGLGTMLSTISLSYWSETRARTGVRESLRSWIIFSAEFQWSLMKIWQPLPFQAQPLIKASEAPSPIPIVCTLEYFIFFLTRLMTWLVSETSPSVSKKICLGQPSTTGSYKMDLRGAQITVPPKFASNFETVSIAKSTLLFSFLTDYQNNFSWLLPKLIILKQVSTGKLFIKSTKALFASSIRLPDIEPLRSSKKIYQPFTESISMSNPYPFIAAQQAYLTLRWQNLGIKDTIAVVLLSLMPKRQEGIQKCSVVQIKLKSLRSALPSSKVNVSQCQRLLLSCSTLSG